MYLDSSFHLIIEKKPKYGNNYEINIRKKIFKKLKIKKMKLRILLNPKVREKKIGNIKNKGKLSIKLIFLFISEIRIKFNCFNNKKIKI